MSDLRPRRSVLYMPAANERALEKAKTLPADAIIFDLEDAVAPDAKEAARPNAVAAAGSAEYGSRELTIRCNGLDTPWGADDLRAAATSGASASSASRLVMVSALWLWNSCTPPACRLSTTAVRRGSEPLTR
jgi:citrate lyase subunit beta/citryl-CoA lyase